MKQAAMKTRTTKKAVQASKAATAPKATDEKPKGTAPATATSTQAKRERKPREEGLVVWACRMTLAERDQLQAACPPARVSRYGRAALIAFSQGDDAAFRKLVKEAEEARAKAGKK